MAAETPITTRQIAAALRDRALSLTPFDLGMIGDARIPTVYGVVIETAHPDAVASLVVAGDGSVSLYVSDGSGCIGCGAHRDVRAAAGDLLQLAEAALPLTEPTHSIALPTHGTVRIHFLTANGTRLAAAPLEGINRIDVRLGALYFAGQRVLATIERVGAGVSLAQEIKLASLALRGSADEARDRASGGPSCLSVGNAVRRLRT